MWRKNEISKRQVILTDTPKLMKPQTVSTFTR